MSQQLSMRLGAVEHETLELSQVQIAYALRLPFRLRIGEYRRFTLDVDGKCEIAFRNALAVKTEEEASQIWTGHARDITKYNTDAVLVLSNLEMSKRDLQILRSHKLDSVAQYPELAPDVFGSYPLSNSSLYSWGSRGIETLKRVLSAYYHVGGRAAVTDEMRYVLANLWPSASVIVTSPLGFEMSDSVLKQLLNLSDIKAIRVTLTPRPKLHDLPDVLLSRMETVLASHGNTLYLEFAFDSFIRISDRIAAFLAMVIALEAAHATFVRIEFVNRANGDVKGAEANVQRYLSEVGMFKLLRITPFLLMDEEEQPSPEELKDCETALQIRNAIMHGILGSGGEPKARKYSHEQISKATSDVESMYRRFVKAIDARQIQV